MIGKFITTLTDAMFPQRFTCDLCGVEIFDGENLCAKCAKTVPPNNAATCPVCGRRTQTNAMCFECKAHSPAFKKAVSALIYKDGAAALVHKFKNGCGYLKEYFADLLAPKCAQFDDAQAVCYIPMTVKAQTKRGYNQAELLARALAKRLNLPVLDGALTKIKETQEQKSLTGTEREQNLKGCFRADRKTIEGKTLILTDDVLTTGATAEAAVTQLKKRGAKEVYFATVASVEYTREI